MLCAQLEATTVNPPAFTDLVNQSDYIVRAVVKSVVSEYAQSGSRKIFTKVELEVLEVITGAPPQPLVLRMPGGRVGQQEMLVDGVPKFSAGEEHVFFIKGNGQRFCPLVGIMHGNYPIKDDSVTRQRYVARSNGAPLYAESDVAKPMQSEQSTRAANVRNKPLSPEAFGARIRQTHELVKRPVLAK